MNGDHDFLTNSSRLIISIFFFVSIILIIYEIWTQPWITLDSHVPHKLYINGSYSWLSVINKMGPGESSESRQLRHVYMPSKTNKKE